MIPLDEPIGRVNPAPEFRTTHWSVVLMAGDSTSSEAARCLASLCELYWFPVYCFIRKRGHEAHQAKDLAQGFFARFLEKNQISKADQNRGRFRSFLMTSVENYLRNEHDRTRAMKRGGGQGTLSLDLQGVEQRYEGQDHHGESPDQTYEREWARTLLNRVLQRLREEHERSGNEALFDALSVHLWGDGKGAPYAELAGCFGMTTVNVKVTAHRLRVRYRELLRAEIADTVSGPGEVDDEIRHLMQVVSS